MADRGGVFCEFLTFSITEGAKAILVFRDNNPASPTPETAEDDSEEREE